MGQVGLGVLKDYFRTPKVLKEKGYHAMKNLFLVGMTVWAFYRHDALGVALGIWLLYESRPEPTAPAHA